MATETRAAAARPDETATSSSSGRGSSSGAPRADASSNGEARTIAYAGEHGYPVPQIHEVRAGGTEIVMERIEGPMMMDEMMRQPWTHAALLPRARRPPRPPARDPGAATGCPIAGGDRLVHLDLHPMNVMMTAAGPVVIDWTNAARGDAAARRRRHVRVAHVPARSGSGSAQRRAPARCASSSVAPFARRYRGRELDVQLVIAAALEGARHQHVARRGRRRSSASERRRPPASRHAERRAFVAPGRPTGIVAVGTGMTGPPGPVIPCTTFRAWSLAVSGS